jgi:hypothetical protein
VARSRNSSLKFNVKGIPEVRKALKIDLEGVTMACRRGMYDAGETILGEAKNVIPFDTGNLSSTATQTERLVGSRYEVEIGFGGEEAPYALVQHERLDFWHPPKPPSKSKVGKRSGTGPGVDPQTGRGAKYLERPMLDHFKDHPATLLAYIRKHYHLGQGKA